MESINTEKYDLASKEITNMLSLYITEDQINQYIYNTQDLSSLKTSLEIKLNFIEENKHSPICFSIDNILNKLNVANIDEVCTVLRFALMIQPNSSQYLVLLEHVHKNLTETSDEHNLKNMLKILQVALLLCYSKMLANTFREFTASSNFHIAIGDLLGTDLTTVMNFMNVYILPRYIEIDYPHSSYVLQVIWKNASESKNLYTLCAIPQFFLPVDKYSCSNYLLVNIDAFWFLLQECLNSNDSTHQKQALYLLKQAIYSIKNETDFASPSKIVFWDLDCKEEVEFAWQNIFMLFEIAREKQLHLIEPSYYLLPTIKILHSSWLICIYKILLTHSHSAVSAYVVINVLQSDWYTDTNIFKMVIKCLLPAINRIEFTDQKDIWIEFNNFNNLLSSEKFIILLQESTQVLWIPSICYQFFRNIFIKERQVFISLDLAENILNTIKKLPHKFIRSGCEDIVVNFLRSSFLHQEKFSFKDYVALSWILYKDTCLLYDKSLDNRFNEHLPQIEQIIRTWWDSKNINIKEVVVIIKIMELPVFRNNWLKEHVFEPFSNKKFVLEISDRIFVLLCKRRLIDGRTLCTYIQERLVTSKHSNGTIIKSVLPLVFTEDNDEIDLISLFDQSSDILLNVESSTFQINLAFELINVLSRHNLLPKNVDNILHFWKKNILEGRKKSVYECLLFLHLYCNKEFCEIPLMSNQKCLIAPEKMLEIIMVFEKIIETGDNNAVPMIFMKLKNLLDLCEELEILFTFVNICFKKIIELKRTEVFKDAVASFTHSLFSNSKILENDKSVMEKTIHITQSLWELAKSSEDVACSLAKSIHYLSHINTKAAASFIPVITELLLFGDVLKKDQRAEYIICKQIDNDKGQEIKPNNPNFQKSSIRGQAVKIVENILNNNSVSQDEKICRADAMTVLLMEKFQNHFNKRYFAHSQIHLQKLRILQALLVVHGFIHVQKQPLIDLLMNSLCSESHQISVKFFIQWLLIRLLHDDDHCVSTITSKMESTSKVHSSTIIAFVPILYHIALGRNDEKFWISLFEIMLPWTMGAHFNLRLYAQEGTKKLYDVALKKRYLTVQEKFKSSADCIKEVLEKTERKIDLIDRFVFDAFNAKDHCNLPMIYFYIPKITNVTPDEYENTLNMAGFHINNDEEMYDIENWLTQSKLVADRPEFPLCTSLIQKKITPSTKFLDPNEAERKIGELVVVASLINKAPNLGGLSRTCEVFGVKQLIMNTTSILKDHEFQSVSMSSENWIVILEIKINQLRSYLLEMKERGYVVVGAEQTSDSVPLNVFRFPKKSALLLGNEKEGIPPNLLSLIDFCVEIPQFGVIRSLNVHVAAATFIWEYAKQHVM